MAGDIGTQGVGIFRKSALRDIPSRVAARVRFPPDWRRAFEIRDFSNCWTASRRFNSVETGATPISGLDERNSSWPRDAYRCNTLRNSRTLPGQSYSIRISITRPGILAVPEGVFIFGKKCSTSSGISCLWLRKGGN